MALVQFSKLGGGVRKLMCKLCTPPKIRLAPPNPELDPPVSILKAAHRTPRTAIARGVATGGVGGVVTPPLLKTGGVSTPTFGRRNRNKN